jgi:enoyl-[acyl-carrier-protein] reductase (NADH)
MNTGSLTSEVMNQSPRMKRLMRMGASYRTWSFQEGSRRDVDSYKAMTSACAKLTMVELEDMDQCSGSRYDRPQAKMWIGKADATPVRTRSRHLRAWTKLAS